MVWHSYSPDISALAAECAKTAESTESFDVIGNVTDTCGTGAVPVRMKSGRLAWAKPGRSADPRLVGREKLAANLGYHLGLPVAPVCISRQTASHREILPAVVALSYETLGAGRDWINFQSTSVEQERLKPTFTALWVFHTWIAERDHRGEGWNLKVERIAAGTLHISSFDYVQSLNDQWQPPAPAAPHADWATPHGVYANPDHRVVDAMTDQIRQFTVDGLEAIIGAIPTDCMPQTEGAALANGLVERARQLETLLGLGSSYAQDRSPRQDI